MTEPHRKESATDYIHISDDKETEDKKDEIYLKKTCTEISDMASKGWRNCSTGFHKDEMKEALKEFSGFSVFRKMNAKDHVANRRKSAPYKLSSMQSLHSVSKENFKCTRREGENVHKEEEHIDTPSSPEDDTEDAHNQDRKVENLKKWAFTDLSNSFCAADKEEISDGLQKQKIVSSTPSIDFDEASTSTKIPLMERIRNKYRRHSTDLNNLKNSKVDRRLHSFKQSIGNEIDEMAKTVSRVKNHDQNNKIESFRRVSKKPKLDDLRSMKESKNVVFDRWIQSLNETSVSTLPLLRGASHGINSLSVKSKLPMSSDKSRYVEHVLISSRETSCTEGNPTARIPLNDSMEMKYNKIIQPHDLLPNPSTAFNSPKKCEISLSPTVHKCVGPVTSGESTESRTKVSSSEVSQEIPLILTPSPFCAQTISQQKSSESPVISSVSSNATENFNHPQPVQITEKRKIIARKSKLPVCSTPFSDAVFSNINIKAPDFSLINTKIPDDKSGNETYHLGSMRRFDSDEEIEEDFDNGTQASVHISSAESQSSDTGPSEVNTGGQKCSDWLQKVSWRKSCINSEMNGEHLDTKELKFQSLLRGGLAEYAWKLEKREKSERVIWSYKKLQKLKSSLHKALTMKIITISMMDSILMSKCSLLKLPSSQTSSASSENGVSKSRFITPDLREGSQCFLLLKSYTAKDMELKSGNVLHVFPPWQILNVPSLSSPVILCAFFVQEEEQALNTESYEDRILDKNIFCGSEDVSGSKAQTMKLDTLSNSQSENVEQNVVKCNSQFSKKIKHQKGDKIPLTRDLDNHDVSEKLGLEIENYSDEAGSTGLTFTGALKIACKKEFSIVGRLQRIWCHVMPESLVQHKLKASNNTTAANSPADARYSLLLEDSNLQFCELQLIGYKPEESPECWKDLIENGEGKSFRFDNLKNLELLIKTRHPLLFSYLRGLRKEQDYLKICCYKASVTCSAVSISDVQNELCPPFVPYCVEPLDRVFAEHNGPYRRITCAVKIVCHAFDTFYLVDHSILNHELSPYVRMKFCPLSFRPASVCVGSIVAVVDAVIKKGVLYVDRYSRVSIVSPLVGSSFISSSQLSNRLGISSEEAIALTFLDSSKCNWKFLSSTSAVADLIQIKGKVVDVDKETAVSWLECNFCSSEDISMNLQKKMFCSSCGAELVSPKMFMNMSVTMEIPKTNLSVSVQLTSTTTKKVMMIPEKAYQPQCDLTDILGKVIGPIFCYVKTKRFHNDVVKFELVEVHAR